MKVLKISQDQYNELCCTGKLAFNYHMVYAIQVLTWFDLVAVSMDTAERNKEVIKLEIK